MLSSFLTADLYIATLALNKKLTTANKKAHQTSAFLLAEFVDVGSSVGPASQPIHFVLPSLIALSSARPG